MMKLEVQRVVLCLEAPYNFQLSKIFQSYSYIYYSSIFLVDSLSLGPLDLEFEAVLFFIWAWLYLQRESAKWAETSAQGVRGVNI